MPGSPTDATPSGNKPAVVFHYTSLETLLKIVNTGSLWATSIKYLNDVSEREHFLGLVRKRIPFYMKEHPQTDRGIFEQIMDKQYGQHLSFDDRPFVVSFSTEKNSLPQWRSYTPGGSGVSIGFRTDALKQAELREDADGEPLEMEQPPKITFRKVNYPNKDKFARFDQVIDIGLKRARAKLKEKQVRGIRKFSEQFYIEMDAFACLIKHPSFDNEKEFRILLSDGWYYDNNTLRYRVVRSTLVPYLPVFVDALAAITEIVVGPTPNVKLTVASLTQFFRSKGRSDIKVTPCRIPFREW